MADNVAITAGTGTTIHTKDRGSGIHDQVVAESRTATQTDDFWTIDTTGAASRVAADPARVLVLMTNMGVGRVFLRYGSTIPAANGSDCHVFLDPGDRYEVPIQNSTLAISVRGASAGGTLNIFKGVA